MSNLNEVEQLKAELDRVKKLALKLADEVEYFNDGCGCCGNGMCSTKLDSWHAVMKLNKD
jgi:hypothetical protein